MNTVFYNIKKGESFRIYFKTPEIGSNGEPSSAAINAGPNHKWIIKNNGSTENLTNSPVALVAGYAYIDLTADEMNANKIDIHIRDSGLYFVSFTIFTDGYNPVSDQVVGNLENLRKFTKKYASGYTTKQLLALIVKLLKS